MSAIESAKQSQTLASALAFQIMARREQALTDRIDERGRNTAPRTYSYLSGVEECDRMMMYAVTNPLDRAQIDTHLKARFEAGELQENQIMIELRQLGYNVVLQQEVVEIKDRQGNVIGRGKIDGHILFEKIKVPVEIKSMHPNVFDSIKSLEDFNKKPYLRKYLKQMTSYLYGNNVEEGLFILTDCLGHWKVFVITLNFEEGEQVLQRLERVHNAIVKGVLPERIPYREEICGNCAFAHICLPDIIRSESDIIVDDEFISRLERREELSKPRSEYEKLDGSIKDDIKKRVTKKAIAGDFVIIISDPVSVREKTVPAYTMQRVSIKKLSELSKPNRETL